MKVQVVLILLALGNIIAANPPTEVVVITSVVCGRCKALASRDLKDLVKVKDYDKLIKLTILPTAHLRQTKSNTGQYTYTHSFGADKVTECFYQFCANGLFSNDRAIKFYTHHASRRTGTIQESAALFFTDKTELANIETCVKGPQGIQFAVESFNLYWKNASSGMLPFIMANKKKYDPFVNGNIATLICRDRTDKSEFPICNGVSSQKDEMFNFLSTEWDYPQDNNDLINEDEEDDHSHDRQQEVANNFDYAKFWNSDDE